MVTCGEMPLFSYRQLLPLHWPPASQVREVTILPEEVVHKSRRGRWSRSRGQWMRVKLRYSGRGGDRDWCMLKGTVTNRNGPFNGSQSRFNRFIQAISQFY